MKNLKAGWLSIVLFYVCACTNSTHFISDNAYRTEVQKQFETRKNDSNLVKAGVFAVFDRTDIPENQKEALQFLYSYMSLNDLADYDGDFFYRQIKWAFDAKNYFSWGKKVPEELFRHFVLPPRVNNENLDTARVVSFHELKDRIKDMSMTDAALEVNHWCHEKVTYRPADSRTSAPLATMRTAYGRCGEESTFTVTALRAVGIPARQCYTPRWAHTDDNHAWVEVWADGKWYFMGACEPEAVLNKAWFTFPVKRAMMVHTNVFGKYYGPESKTDYPLFTKINVLENYTTTKKLTVKILDEQNRPVTEAQVKFLLYNYSEYYPIYEQTTDKNGEAYVISGLGDLIVWASKDDKYGYQKVSLKDSQNLSLTLNKTKGQNYVEEWDIYPPVNQAVYLKDTTARTLENNKRLLFEDSIRNHYLATFMTADSAKNLAKKIGLDAAKVGEYILKSEGNYREVTEYLTKNAKNPNVLKLLSTLTDNDLRDTPAQVLQSHLDNTQNSAGLPEDVFVKGILSPRINTELIREWRPFLQNKFNETFGGNRITSSAVRDWLNTNIKTVENENYSGCLISPIGVYSVRKADKKSREVFYVALCRSLNIPTIIDPATSEIKHYENGKWTTISLEPEVSAPINGKLILNYQSSNRLTPNYSSYYTISKFDKGFFKLLDFENDKRVEKFPVQLDLEEGYYCLTTGNRYADGRVLARNEYFTISKTKPTVKELIIRSLKVEKKVYGTLKTDLLSADLYNQKPMVVCFIEPDKEPSKHLLNELVPRKTEFDKWNGNFVFVVPDEVLNKALKFNIGTLPKKSTFITENGTKTMEHFLKSANQSFRENYPLIYVVNPSGEMVFYSEGYHIGLGDLILKTVTDKQ